MLSTYNLYYEIKIEFWDGEKKQKKQTKTTKKTNKLLNPPKRKNGRRNIFMTKSSRRNVPDAGIDLTTACIPSGIATNQAYHAR